MAKFQWYWHRLRAMEPGEVVAHVRKQIYQRQDTRRLPDWAGLSLESIGSFPKLPSPDAAPPVLRDALDREAREIIAGRWKAFSHLEIQVDDPPQWHKDYFVGKNLATNEIAFKLNHRELPDGADIKLIWELSRWHQLVRLAMAAYVSGDERAARKCVEWLEDWVKHNPPYRGWNWTSALEVGMRLVQFTWIDALLQTQTEVCGGKAEVTRLLREILPAHAWYAWRYRSFGSSANNHLIGELAGLILAVARWPELAKCSAPLDELQRLWEREVVAQFAEDGGNREQALNYHLFSWEFCWQARAALLAVGGHISPDVDERLCRAARFFWEVQVRREPWDYGDSDNALVTPFFTQEKAALIEWRDWLSRAVSNAGASYNYWLGDPPELRPPLGKGEPAYIRKKGDWWFYPHTGIAICESGFWFLRWDLSPLGYLKTAAHGHLDALHLSIWFNGVAMVIDPGTGAYYADRPLRNWLASEEAHNLPLPDDYMGLHRLGPFLWSNAHSSPDFFAETGHSRAFWKVPGRAAVDWAIQRAIKPVGTVLEIADSLLNAEISDKFSVHWQFAPGARLEQLSERRFQVKRNKVLLDIEVSENWAEIHPVIEKSSRAFTDAATNAAQGQFAGTVSQAFRKVEWAPFLKLVARPAGDKSCVFLTRFLASPHS